MANPENIDKGAKEVATLLDAHNSSACEERLRSDLFQMSPDEFRQFVQKVSKYDKKDTGLDIEIKDNEVTLSHYSNAAAKLVGLKSTEVFTRDMGGWWAHPGFKAGSQRYVLVGVGFRESDEQRDKERNKGKFIEQKK